MPASDCSLPQQSPFSCVVATKRPFGAVRYRCPESGSFVLLTDPEALKRSFMRPIRCVGCGGLHRLMQEEEGIAAA